MTMNSLINALAHVVKHGPDIPLQLKDLFSQLLGVLTVPIPLPELSLPEEGHLAQSCLLPEANHIRE